MTSPRCAICGKWFMSRAQLAHHQAHAARLCTVPPPTMVVQTRPVLVKPDGTTTCCNAYTSIFADDGVEYCKACYHAVEAHLPTVSQ